MAEASVRRSSPPGSPERPTPENSPAAWKHQVRRVDSDTRKNALFGGKIIES
jgi:hypothetical protein